MVFARTAWEALRSTWLEPPLPALVGERLGLGATATDAALLAAIRVRLETSGELPSLDDERR
jgi:hypothetical protein